MLAFIKRNLFIVIIFIITISLAFITFLTFINKSFIELTEDNLQLLLIFNIIILLLFFILIFIDIKNSINQCNNEVEIEFELNNLYKKYEDLPFNYGLLRK